MGGLALQAVAKEGDSLSHILFLLGNMAFALFVLIAHGGYYLVGPHDGLADQWPLLTVGLALLVIFSSIVALIKKTLRQKIMNVQAILVFAVVVVLLGWSTTLFMGSLIGSSPSGRIAWGVGLLTGLTFYGAFQLRHVVLQTRWPAHHFVKYLPWYLGGWAAVVDIGMFVMLLSKFWRLWNMVPPGS